MRIISYGGGQQTAALAVLNATGRVTPRATHAVFADPGAEMPGTYAHIDIMSGWLAERGIELVTVRNENDGPLEAYVREKSTPIPVQFEGGIGRRQCTSKWKIEVIERWLREQGAVTATVQLGISWDEMHRMKPNPKKWVTNRWPLIEMRLTRQDCHNIMEEARLPIPPRSACYFCPFHRVAAWQELAVFHPELFDRACDLERVINERKDYKKRERVYLSSRKRPLGRAFSKHQLPLPGLWWNEPDDLCGGYCMV